MTWGGHPACAGQDQTSTNGTLQEFASEAERESAAARLGGATTAAMDVGDVPRWYEAQKCTPGCAAKGPGGPEPRPCLNSSVFCVREQARPRSIYHSAPSTLPEAAATRRALRDRHALARVQGPHHLGILRA
eukprot:COSAG06_NODE_22794_length_712_cov_1.086460_2_plen_131_part_01